MIRTPWVQRQLRVMAVLVKWIADCIWMRDLTDDEFLFWGARREEIPEARAMAAHRLALNRARLERVWKLVSPECTH